MSVFGLTDTMVCDMLERQSEGGTTQKGGVGETKWKGGVVMRKKWAEALRVSLCILFLLAFAIYFSPLAY